MSIKKIIMRYKGQLFFSVLLLGLLAAAYFPNFNFGQSSADKEIVLMKAVLEGFGQMHYQPKDINDEFSEEVFDFYLDQVDGGRRFLTQEDIAKLEPYKRDIDDQASKGTFEFFDQSVALLNGALDKTQQFYQEALDAPLDYYTEEDLELDGTKRPFAKNDAELKAYWHQYVKYEVLSRIVDKQDEQAERQAAAEAGEAPVEGAEEAPILSYEEIEQQTREEVREFFDEWYSRMRKLKREDRMSVYLNAFTHLFDPHSEYYKPIDKENFNIRFSGKLEGIGATLRTEGDFTKVVQVVVGGPAWKQKELEAKDVILKVKQEDEEQATDITGMTIDDVVQLIRGPKDTKVRLTVKKLDGTIKDIVITRDIVILEEQFAKSLLIEGASEDERIGYLQLPSFYADFQDKNGRFSATDVEAELEKLKKEGVSGIILDLRYNGGGSLRDVIKMTGFFFEKGPVVQVKSRESAPEVLRDTDSRVQYDGPLIVMVNSYSASASEILAAALQDYGRAVIVGSPSTYGKGTVQRFVDLDRTIRGFAELKPLGEIKLTTQKFYRVNGGSTQLKGVSSDIVLPDNLYYIKTGERDRDYAMEWTEIEPVPYGQSTNTLSASQINDLRRSSQQRIAENSIFQKILSNAKRLEEQREDTAYPLHIDRYREMLEKRKASSDEFDDLLDEEVLTSIQNLPVDIPRIEADESKKARNDEWLKSVSKDIYIKETLNIMHDMLGSNQ